MDSRTDDLLSMASGSQPQAATVVDVPDGDAQQGATLGESIELDADDAPIN